MVLDVTIRALLFRFVPPVIPLLLAVTVAACSGTSDPGGAVDAGDAGEGGAVAAGGDRGAEVYASSCASCHGTELEGTDKGPPQLSIVYEPGHHPDLAYETAIANGARQHHWNFGDMPPVEGLSESDVAAVIAFIRSEQERVGFER